MINPDADVNGQPHLQLGKTKAAFWIQACDSWRMQRLSNQGHARKTNTWQ